MKKQSYFIYGLIDPRDSSLCYIGCTIRPRKERLRQHNNVPDTHKSKMANLSRHKENSRKENMDKSLGFIFYDKRL